jgi:putative transposase
LDKEARMKRSRFSEEQIIGILKESEAGRKAEDICREHGISKFTFYDWRKKFQGLTVSEAKRLKALEEENRKLKVMVADLTLDNIALKDVLSKKW